VRNEKNGGGGGSNAGAKGSAGDSKGDGINPTLSKSSSIKHNDKPFDEALEFSQSGSDESVDTVTQRNSEKKKGGAGPSQQQQQNSARGPGGPPGPDFKAPAQSQSRPQPQENKPGAPASMSSIAPQVSDGLRLAWELLFAVSI
jgi:hypothetical protein